jgi:hypothetical protein
MTEGVPPCTKCWGSVDIDEHHRLSSVFAGWQQRRVFVEVGQETGGDRVELPDMAEGERAQERTQSRGSVDAVEQVCHAAVAEDVHVIDRVGSGSHPADECGQFRRRVRAFVSAGGRHGQTVFGEVEQAGLLGEAHDRDQPSGCGEVLIVEGVGHSRGGVVE